MYHLVQNFDSEGGCLYVGVGDIWEISIDIFSVQFFSEPKVALKNKIY